MKVRHESQPDANSTAMGYVLHTSGGTVGTTPLSVVSASLAQNATLTSPPESVTINFSAPVDFGSLTPGALTVNGVPGGDFVLTFNVDRVAPAEIATPVWLSPLGTLAAVSSPNTGLINSADDTDMFRVFAQTSQYLTAVLTQDGGLLTFTTPDGRRLGAVQRNGRDFGRVATHAPPFTAGTTSPRGLLPRRASGPNPCPKPTARPRAGI